MAENKQGELIQRSGPGANNIAPGSTKRADQTIQSLLNQQINIADKNNNKNNNNNTTLLNRLRLFFDSVIQKLTSVSTSNRNIERILENLSKKIDLSINKLELNQKTKDSAGIGQDVTSKLL